MCLHRKGNHWQNKMTTYGMGENICKWCDQQCINFQNIQTASTTQHQKMKNNPIKNGQKALIDVSPKKAYKWSLGTWKDAQYWRGW